MPIFGVRVIRGGQPVEGARVTISDKISVLTPADGVVSKSLTITHPICVPIVVQGEGFETGIANATLEPGKLYEIEV